MKPDGDPIFLDDFDDSCILQKKTLHSRKITLPCLLLLTAYKTPTLLLK